jgi:predicted O-linked N-acetylglucosamine transferase (SPINDLY family)
MAQGITADPAAFVQKVIELGQDRAMLRQWREQLARSRAKAPLFDAPARVREWESAWTEMAKRQQAGLPPAAFDVARVP